MKIFILDDDKEVRWAFFKEKFKGHDLFMFSNANEFWNTLKDQFWVDMIFLDHDLGDFGENYTETTYGGRSEITGEHVAMWMQDALVSGTWEIHPACDPKVVVHTMNPAGGPRMEFLLKEAGLNVYTIPYSTLIKVLEAPLL